MEITISTIHEDLLKMRKDIELLKNILISEGELTPFAIKSLKKAREEPESSYTDLSDL